MTELFTISYQGGGFAKINPKHIEYIRYSPEDNGKVFVHTTSGDSVIVTNCTKQDARHYADQLDNLLAKVNGSIDLPKLSLNTSEESDDET